MSCCLKRLIAVVWRWENAFRLFSIRHLTRYEIWRCLYNSGIWLWFKIPNSLRQLYTWMQQVSCWSPSSKSMATLSTCSYKLFFKLSWCGKITETALTDLPSLCWDSGSPCWISDPRILLMLWFWCILPQGQKAGYWRYVLLFILVKKKNC